MCLCDSGLEFDLQQYKTFTSERVSSKIVNNHCQYSTEKKIQQLTQLKIISIWFGGNRTRSFPEV